MQVKQYFFIIIALKNFDHNSCGLHLVAFVCINLLKNDTLVRGFGFSYFMLACNRSAIVVFHYFLHSTSHSTINLVLAYVVDSSHNNQKHFSHWDPHFSSTYSYSNQQGWKFTVWKLWKVTFFFLFQKFRQINCLVKMWY